MNTLKKLTYGPALPQSYKEFLAEKKSSVILFAVIFAIFTIIISTLIGGFKFFRGFSVAWKEMKTAVAKEVNSATFNYIGIENAKLVTDLKPQPYIRQFSDKSYRESTVIIFAVDSTGKVNDSVLSNSQGREVMGFAFLKDHFVTKSNSRVQSYYYADMGSDNTDANDFNFRITKTQILNFIQSDDDKKLLQKFFSTPSVIFTTIIIALFVFIFAVGIKLIGMLIWVVIVGLIAYLITKAGPRKNVNSAFKLAILGYVLSWYIGYIQDLTFRIPFIGGLIGPAIVIYFIVTTLQKDPTPQAEVKS